jgi:hypothetical protein
MKRFSTFWLRSLFGALLALYACIVMPAADSTTAKRSVKALLCVYGGVSMRPISPPPGFDSEFAVAVVEINSPSETKNAAVSDFVLLDRTGRATKFKRVVNVEQFNGTLETKDSYKYFNPIYGDGTRSWNGTLPVGRIRLRVRVALVNEPIAPVSFRLVIGRYVIKGPVNGAWGT